MSVCSIVIRAGYEFTEYLYDTTTNDNCHYQPTTHRIRSSEVSAKQKGEAPAVLLQHGLTSSSDMWVAHKPDLAVAFQLAKSGYDVWLGNNRGNKYSRKSLNCDPNSQAKTFFEFSFDELGKYDL